jgi:type IV secretory pathway VirJ component
MNSTVKITTLLLISVFLKKAVVAQTMNDITDLPVNAINTVADTSKPMIIYITGDGGWNKFSKGLAQSLAGKGYPIVALSADKYFWKKKTAEQTTTDVTKLIKVYQKQWNRKKILLVGYSFGADVMPFVFNNLSKEIAAEVLNVSLLSPSAKTDFEIHISVMFGGSSDGDSVPAAINKINAKPLTLIFGEDENDFPVTALTIKNYTTVKLSGGHHYDGDGTTVANTIIQYIPKK